MAWLLGAALLAGAEALRRRPATDVPGLLHALTEEVRSGLKLGFVEIRIAARERHEAGPRIRVAGAPELSEGVGASATDGTTCVERAQEVVAPRVQRRDQRGARKLPGPALDPGYPAGRNLRRPVRHLGHRAST